MNAYLLAGSFVGFLLERSGLARFHRVYETEYYKQVYGKSFERLETEWRTSRPE
jgi:predicted metal-dependent hydrolase